MADAKDDLRLYVTTTPNQARRRAWVVGRGAQRLQATLSLPVCGRVWGGARHRDWGAPRSGTGAAAGLPGDGGGQGADPGPRPVGARSAPPPPPPSLSYALAAQPSSLAAI